MLPRILLLYLLATLSAVFIQRVKAVDFCSAGDDDSSPFKLFQDFDVSLQVAAWDDHHWNWDRLVNLRRTLHRSNWSFYIDKVSYKRHLQNIGIQIPKPYLLKHAVELGSDKDVFEAIYSSVEGRKDYAAKPTHLSTSDGVFAIKDFSHNVMDRKTVTPFRVAAKVALTVNQKPFDFESWALFEVPPGVVVEDRITHWEDDTKAGIEFKVFMIWGKVWQAKWRRGEYTYGVVFRNGTMHEKSNHKSLPSWLAWEKVVSIAEKLGANKDMFRTDIFVGVPAGSKEGTELMYAVSEAEIHPTTSMDAFSGFAEATSLWLKGYRETNFRVIPNSEIPSWWSPRYGRAADH